MTKGLEGKVERLEARSQIIAIKKGRFKSALFHIIQITIYVLPLSHSVNL